eukprot:m.18951 g.18951  ORF g.18951 m.18951 type:complete len:520 (-) comp12270_c0_seq1:38-1597(-)
MPLFVRLLQITKVPLHVHKSSRTPLGIWRSFHMEKLPKTKRQKVAKGPESRKAKSKTVDAMAPPRMDIQFLGTASMMPSKTRNTSCVGLRVGPAWWMFDVGEGTQHQTIHDLSHVRTGSITRIFVTHLHGDHCFGLPGLLCKMGSAVPNRMVEIVGPPGLRQLVRQSLILTHSGLMFKYTVHELWIKTTKEPELSGKMHYNEIRGENVMPEADGTWVVPSLNHDVSGFTVRAAKLAHSVPTVGYVVEERTYPGTFVDPKVIIDRVMKQENLDFLKKKGVKQPLSVLRDLKQGQSVTLSDGVVEPSDVLGHDKQGRKIVVMGDTKDSWAMAQIAYGCDLLIHEATNAFIQSLDTGLVRVIQQAKGVPKENWDDPLPEHLALAAESVLAKTITHGHSTPHMAAQFATDIAAQHLVLTHFSARYKDDPKDEECVAVMDEIVEQAKELFDKNVTTAKDFMIFELPVKKDPTLHVPAANDKVAAAAALQISRDHSQEFRKRCEIFKSSANMATALKETDAHSHD